MSARQHTGGATALPTAAAFVAIGGRLMLSPKGELQTSLDAMILFDVDRMPEASRAAYDAAQAMKRTLADSRAVTVLKCHVLRTGERTPGGWLVVEVC